MSLTLPSMSIVTPSYNQADYIESTIHSVLEQQYPELDYLIMDGGSQDGTVDILRRFDGRLRWVSERDGGQSAAVNEGFRRTTGEIIGWVNSDDEYAPGALRVVGQYFAEHPQVEWLFGRCPIIDKRSRPYKAWITRYKEFWLRRYSYRRLLIENFISQPAVFFRRRLLDQVGHLDPAYHCAMDYHLWVRMGAVAKPAFIDRELAYFRISGENKMSLQYQRSFDEELHAARRVADGQYPILMFLHRVNRVKLITAYNLLARLSR
jgi:glycosyltransferase involved in cell wall biosynthesis